jgi:hypothetical protein
VIDEAFGGKTPGHRRAPREAIHLSGLYLHWDDAPHTAVEILRRAHDLIAFGWCQGADATDADHNPVEPWSAHACRWSLLGALAAGLGPVEKDTREDLPLMAELRLALVAIGTLIPDWSLQHWNDSRLRTRTDVLGMLAAARQHCVPTALS